MEYNIKISGDQLQYIVNILKQQPYHLVNELIASIMTQVKIQNDMESNKNS